MNDWNRQPRAAITMSLAKKILNDPSNEVLVMRAMPVGLSRLAEDISGNELGEALLMVGKAYEFLADFQPMDLHENYYESCIRSVPHSQVAKKCWGRLKASVEMGYTGTSGMNIPVDIEIWLGRLKSEAQ